MKSFLPLALLAALAACRKDQIETRRVPKEGAPQAPAAAPLPRGLRWTAPKGWTELPGSALRAASFRLPRGTGEAEATVVVFPGDAGGEVANVNRWRGQIALPPLTAPQLDTERSTVVSKAGKALVYDFTSGGVKKTRLAAGMIRASGATWFFKLTGEERAVAAAKPAFLELLKGLRSDVP